MKYEWSNGNGVFCSVLGTIVSLETPNRKGIISMAQFLIKQTTLVVGTPWYHSALHCQTQRQNQLVNRQVMDS